MVVMVIIVLASGMVIVSMAPALSDARLRSGSRMVVSVLNYARSYAAAHQTQTRVVFDRAENGIMVEVLVRDQNLEEELRPLQTSVGKYRKLPTGLTLGAVRKPGTDEEEDYIGFTQTGQAEGASVAITDSRGRQRRIIVDGITGRCVVESDEANANPQSETRYPE